MRRALHAIPAVVFALLGAMPAFAQETVAVVTRTVYPGETLSAGMLEEVPLKRALKPGAEVAISLHEIVGKVAVRTLIPKRMIPLASVRDPFSVERGSRVQVLFSAGALTISATGVPLESGSAGDQVKVRNVDSGAVFTGTVMADGTIRVGAT